MTDILIVEDNKELADLLCDFLRAENYTVSVAETGEKALSLYEKYGARLVVLDINLPGVDGFAVCSRIREHSNAPILIVSARTDKDAKLDGLIRGADDYIEKPYDIDILLAKIAGIFKRRYAIDEITEGSLRLNKETRTVYKNDVQLGELELQKEKKTLLLSLSHDIKTPLSAIKLYSKALSKGLYTDKEKQFEIAESINGKADEIEKYISQIIKASSEDFLQFDVQVSEFYLSELLGRISDYYSEKTKLIHTDFTVGDFSDCLVSGDIERSTEVLQNIVENALKYGDGKSIEILTGEEDGCQLITVRNSGNTLPENELPHIFDSFYRGSNAGNNNGSGLGLYICRSLMRKMNGDIFAEADSEFMNVSCVFQKA